MQRFVKYLLLGLLALFLSATFTPLQAATNPPEIAAEQAADSSPLESGRTLYAAGQYAGAADAWQAAARAYADQGDRANQALSLSYLSLAYQNLNQWDEAKEAIADSLTLLEAGAEPILQAQILNTQASLLLHTGQAQSALETWESARAFYEQANDDMGALGARVNQAQALQSLGFYNRSQRLLDEINQQLTDTPDSPLKVSALQSLGIALNAIGNFSASQDVLKYGLKVAQGSDSTAELSPLLLSLGNTAAALEKPGDALYYFQQAEQTAINSLERVEAQLGQLNVYLQQGQWQQGETLAPQIQRQLAELPPSRMSIYATVNLVSSLNKYPRQQQPISVSEVNEFLARSVQGAKALQDSQAQAYALHQWSKLYGRNNQSHEAMKLARESLAIARGINADDIVSQSAWQLGQLLKNQGQPKEAIAAYTEAVNSLQALRQDLVAVDRSVQFSFRESVEPVYRELIALLLDTDPNQENLKKVRNLMEALQLAELDNFFRQACINAQVEQIDRIDPSATVIYPIILPDRLAVIFSTPGQPLRYSITPVSKTELDETLETFLASLNPVSDNIERLDISQKVYDWLIRPGENQQAFVNTETLVFVLDGQLRNIPMAALHDGQQYLIEKYRVALSPGLQLMQARSLERDKLNAVVGGISESRFGLSPLPAVQSEVKTISQLMSASTLLNQEFTKQTLEKQIQNRSSNIVHLATHGQFSSRQEDTFLLTWEGRINIQELAEMLQSRDNASESAIELLVLSACDTAAGDDRAVLGLAGLAVRSGARSTLATLWPVKDNAAAVLMKRFYQELQQPGTTKAEALRNAQLSLLQSESYRDPFFWSPFVLVGNWL